MTQADDPKLAQVKIHPAVIVMGCFMISLVAKRAWQLNLDPGKVLAFQYLGVTLVVIGVAILALAYSAMASAKTTINPSEHTSRVVSSGIYAYSRNSIYLGWFIFIAGIGFKNTSLLVLILAVFMITLLYWAVILEEEKYLENKFGEDYLRYKRNVRRWL